IGQMLFTIDHNAGYLKVTMVDPEFQEQGIATQIGFEMLKVEKLMNALIFKCVYAIINEGNVPIIKVLKNFNFKFLGRIPPYEHNKGLIIFGLIRYDYSWKMIKPHLKLCHTVYNIIKSISLKRIISASNFNINSHSIENYDLELIRSDVGNHEKKIFQIRTIKGENIAEIIENQYQNSWYDFSFLRNNLSLTDKKKVLDRILQEYSFKKNIHSISFPIPINDVYSQKILIDSGAKFYAYLPFYYRDYDSILLGFSKFKKEVN
ncbi:MAG: GNAT family N-acetyltransferase, partial [Promethearchaeota archaeon]